MEAVALFSFSASEPDELSFHKGDIVKVAEMEEDSYWVVAEIQGKRGFVPENYISLLPHPWFAGAVSRFEAEQRLRWQDTGVFLLRESESAPGEFSLSVSYGDRVEHFRVLEGGGQYCIWEKTFCSLNRLVEFYRSHSIAVEKVVCLRDAPISPYLPSHPARNPYPSPYKRCSRESAPPGRLPSRLSQPERVTSPCSVKPSLEAPRLANALCDYTPAQSSRLHFLRGDIVELLDCSGNLSWTGRCRGRVGMFPSKYVQPLYQ